MLIESTASKALQNTEKRKKEKETPSFFKHSTEEKLSTSA